MADTLGLLLAVLVTAAGIQDAVVGVRLFDQVAADHPTIHTGWVDGGYRRHFVKHAATLGINMEVAARTPGTRGFYSGSEAVDGRVDLRLAHAPPPPGPRP